MQVILKIDNPNILEKQLLDFLKQQKQDFEEITLEALNNFINSFQKKKKLIYKKRDIRNHISVIQNDDNEPRDENIELYSHVEDSGEYIHNLTQVRHIML